MQWLVETFVVDEDLFGAADDAAGAGSGQVLAI
jgi:hypothetical protein